MSAVADQLETFVRDVIRDAAAEATARYWERRAEWFERAAPQPADFTGHADPDTIEQIRRRMLATAAACRNRAAVERMC